MKIVEYKIITDRLVEALEVKVNAAIGEGWQPHYGLIKAMPNKTATKYCQAMVKVGK